MTWSVQALDGLMEVSDSGENVVANSAALTALTLENRGLFDSVSIPPLVDYESTGEGDQTAAYLNALFYLPDPKVMGHPPITIEYGDVITPEGGESVPESKALPQSYRRQRKPDEDFHTGGMIALLPDAETAAKLHVPGGDDPDELHVTLFFMSDVIVTTEAQRDVLRAYVGYLVATYGFGEPMLANISGAGVLGDEDAKVYLVGDSFEMKLFYDRVKEVVDNVSPAYFPVYGNQREPWIAHLTAGYGDKVSLSKMKYRGPVRFDRVRLAIGETYTDFPLSGGRQLADDTLEYLSRTHIENDSTAEAIDGPETLKSLANKDDVPAHIKLAAMAVTNEEIAEDFLEGKKRGNAETLRRYWTTGEGAPKIVWGRPGDFKACVKKLRKYLRDPEGYCANLHHRATGEWPGPKAHGGKGLTFAPDSIMDHIKRLVLDAAVQQDNLSENPETKES